MKESELSNIRICLVIIKVESRENIKKSPRARFDPAKSTTTTLDHLKRIEAANAAADTGEDEEDEESGESENEVDNPRPSISEGPSLTYEELRQRLHKRIDELRSGRNTQPQLLIQQRPVKVEKRNKERKKDEKGNDSASNRKKEEATESSKGNTKRKMANRDGGAGAPDISFGKINVGGEDNDRRKKRKLSKKHQLEKAKKLEEAKKDPEKGTLVSKKHSWKAAVSRAAGVKVHDDPKLLKESMKKGKKRQQKHAENWKERTKIMEKSKAEKQKTRAANIKERIHQKKTSCIEKREKKLIRPGFEGRKEGYING